MKIEQIRTFLEIAGCGNFNRAAAALHVTQSTVSARVKAMEEEFGRPLFKRNHNGVELTDAGHRFRRYGLGIYRLWQQSHHELLLPEGISNIMALGAQTSLWEGLILDWIPIMRTQMPQVALRVEAGLPNNLMRQLADGLLNIGVMYEPRQTEGLVIDHLFEEQLVMVASVPRTVNLGWVEDYIFVDWGDAFRAQHAESFSNLESPAVSIGLGSVALQYLVANGGSGYFPMRMVQPLLEEEKLFLVNKAPRTRRSAYVVFPAGARDDETLEFALDKLREVARDSP